MSLRTQVRRLTGHAARHEERLIQLELDRDELFRRTNAQLDLIGGQNEVNRAMRDEIEDNRAETLGSFKIVDEAVGTLNRRLEALEDSELSLRKVSMDPEVMLAVACDERRVITFKYRDREGQSSYRVVSPYEIEEKWSAAHVPRSDSFLSLVAWDHGREGIRHFRVERIEGPVTTTRVEPYRQPQREETT